ncbi:hypothetical protein V6N11_033883 [Hibiscus sabdariffa]|uniref:Uncharacterized protein n=1 Tax=Hibiscus sabdariffa TaxID=183260 RepID=A0ABR2S0W6_9ROSI
MVMDPEELRITLLKGVEAILDKTCDKFLSDFRNDLKVSRERVNVQVSTMEDGFGEQKQQQQLVTSSIESKVFDKLSMTTNVDSVDFDDSISGLLEVPQNEGWDILNKGLLDLSPIQGIRLDSLMMMRGMSFTGTNVVTSEWVSNYKPCRFLVPSFDPGESNTTVNSGHDVINTGSDVQNLHSYTMLEIAEIIAKLSRLSLPRTRNIDTCAYM